jgi:AbrB family looped-hinge helix DNA binding protein
MRTITISSKNQIVIPSSVRATLGVNSGDKLIIEQVSSKELVLRKAPSFSDLAGTLPSQNRDPVDRVRNLRDNWK